MNIKELKAKIADMPDDAPVLIESSDHGYRDAWIKDTTALKADDGTWTEDIFIPTLLDEGIGEATEYGVRVRALCLA